MICKLDRDLADSLDECNIHNRSRSDMVNAIVRTFFKTYLPQLAQYRRDNKSLFTNYKEAKHEDNPMDRPDDHPLDRTLPGGNNFPYRHRIRSKRDPCQAESP